MQEKFVIILLHFKTIWKRFRANLEQEDIFQTILHVFNSSVRPQKLRGLRNILFSVARKKKNVINKIYYRLKPVTAHINVKKYFSVPDEKKV